MKNNLFKNTIDLKIKGKNIERFIKRINQLSIDIYDIKYLKYNEIIIRINKDDLNKIDESKTIYELEVININGIDKIKILIKKNIYLILGIIISILLLIYLSNTIFSVEVIHNDENLRTLLIAELKEEGIEKYKMKKSYQELQIIKKKILEKYQDKIEWLEIINSGTKYIVRVEERILKSDDNSFVKRNIVAKKDALLLKINASTGEVLKEINQYVHKGDIIISGNINLYEETKDSVMADGKIYGEVWYKATVEYPLYYQEETITGKKKKVLVFNWLNYEINLFDFHPFKDKKVTTQTTIFANHLLPISLSIQEQLEVKKIEEDITEEEAVNRAIEKAKKSIESKLNEKEYIIDTKKLKVEQNNSRIIVEVFFSVCEDITDYQEIQEE
jgi:similar to stage IV sporulation protein